MKLKTRELEKLREKLPPNWDQILWGRLNKWSISTIKAVLSGRFNNDRIINAAIELAEEYKVEQEKVHERINSL